MDGDDVRLAEAAKFFETRGPASALSQPHSPRDVASQPGDGTSSNGASSADSLPADVYATQRVVVPPLPSRPSMDGEVRSAVASPAVPVARKPPAPPPRGEDDAQLSSPEQTSEPVARTPAADDSSPKGPMLTATVYTHMNARADAPQRRDSRTGGAATTTTKLYSFLPGANMGAPSIEQVDGDDDLDAPSLGVTASALGADAPDPVPRTRVPTGLDMDFEHSMVDAADDVDEDDDAAIRARHPVPGMNGSSVRGRCIDEIVNVYDTARGLPATPESVAAVGGRTHVVARVRPQTAMELSEGGVYCLSVSEDGTSVTVAGAPGLNRDTVYALHAVLGPDTEQEQIYEQVAHPIVEGVLYGYNGTILAYGQTGSGKTYTTFGAHKDNSSIDGEIVEGLQGDKPHRGLIPRSIETLFAALRTLPPDVHVEVSVSMVEIYQDKIRDLLASRQPTASVSTARTSLTAGAAFGSSVASSAAAWVASPNAAASTVALPIPGVSPAGARAMSPRRSGSFHPSALAVLPIASQAAAAAAALGSPLRANAPSVYRMRATSGASDATGTPGERAPSPRSRPSMASEAAALAASQASPKFNPLRSVAATAAAHTYGEEDPDNLSLVVDPTFGVQLCGATSLTVKSESQVLDVLRIGASNRAVAATGMNEESSRSHCIVIMTVLQESAFGVRSASDAEQAEEQPPAGAKAVRYSKLYFVDLAGSERPNKSKVTGVQLQEAQAINSSLSTLGGVINALANGDPHVPYRDSKLTRTLQDGLGANSRTALIINVSPSSFNAEETKSSLRFGATAARVRTKAAPNMLNPVMLARKETLSRLQRAKSYSTYLRDTQKAESEARARDRARRQTIAKQKMKHLRLTSPEEAMATPAPSNVVIPEATPMDAAALASGEDADVTDDAFTTDGRSTSPQPLRSPRESRTSPDALRALLRHPSAPVLLGPAAHHFLKDLAAKFAAEDAEKTRAAEQVRHQQELEAAAAIAAAEGVQTYTEDAYGVPITIQIGPALTQGHDASVSQYLHGADLSGAAEEARHAQAAARVLRRSMSDSSGDAISPSDILRGWKSVAPALPLPLPPAGGRMLPPIADSEDEDESGDRSHAATLTASADLTARGRSISATGTSLVRTSSTGSVGGRSSPRLSLAAVGHAAVASVRSGRASVSGASMSGAAAMPAPVLRVLAPGEIYSVTLMTSPLGFRFFEPGTAVHIMSLLPSLSKAKWVPTSLPNSLGGGGTSSGSTSSGIMNYDTKPVVNTALLPVVETVLPGFPADTLTADGSGAVAFAEQFLAAATAGIEDADADRMSEERAKGWESRGAIGIGDRLLAVNGIRLDILPLSLTNSHDASGDGQHGNGGTMDAVRYAEVTNRAVKLVKFAMQAVRARASSMGRERTPSAVDAASATDDGASSTGSPEPGSPRGQQACVLTFVSAGPYVRRGIMVGLRLALHHETHLRKMHETALESASNNAVLTDALNAALTAPVPELPPVPPSDPAAAVQASAADTPAKPEEPAVESATQDAAAPDTSSDGAAAPAASGPPAPAASSPITHTHTDAHAPAASTAKPQPISTVEEVPAGFCGCFGGSARRK